LAQKERLRKRPQVGAVPLAWKEIYVEPAFSYNWFGRAILCLLVAGSFLPGLVLIFIDLLDPSAFLFDILFSPKVTATSWTNPVHSVNPINQWVRITGTLVATLTLLSVALRAANSIGGERERQTWDSLLTTPLDSNDILYGKWLGSLLSVRWALLWLLLIWGVGVLSGGLYIYTVPCLLAAWFLYASCLGFLGLWFSMVCRTSLRATLWTLAVTVVIFSGSWLTSAYFDTRPATAPPRLVWGSPPFVPPPAGSGVPIVFPFFGEIRLRPEGVSPIRVFGSLAFPRDDSRPGNLAGWEDAVEVLDDIEQGLIVWTIATVSLIWVSSDTLRSLTGRKALRPRTQGSRIGGRLVSAK
jgi:ABC-type transport system involved in multi-copper enzyme maturation permease subunit